MEREKIDYCKCRSTSFTTGFENDWGYWDVCTKCGKRIEDGLHMFNHYDGQDHEEFWTRDGDIETYDDEKG